jgi:hypothetical protein
MATVMRIKNEPIAIANGAAGALGIAASFGLPISPDQKLELAGAFVGIANWWARSQVVPTARLTSGTVMPSGPGEPVVVAPSDGSAAVVVAKGA